MAKVYSSAESVESIAQGLIANFHAELATARIIYCFVDSVGTKGGREQLGKVRKFSGFQEWALDSDFVIEVGLDKWNESTESQRTALIDHLLERCTGDEVGDSGEIKWKVREPDVQEFSSVLHRQGAWSEDLQGFVSVAQGIKIDDIIEEEDEVDVDELVDVTTGEG
jgi:hypothetical protein